VKADTELPEAEVSESGLRAINEREAFGRDFRAIGNARGKAGGGGTIPSGEIGTARKFANLGFAEADVEERSENVMLGCGTMAGAEVEAVVGVDAVGNGGDVFCDGERVEDGEEFVLAEVAAVAGIGAVGGVVHLVGFDEFVANEELCEEGSELLPVVRGITRRDSGDGEGTMP